MSFAWDIGEHVPFEVSKMCTGEGPPSLKIHRLSTGRTERHFTRQLLLLQGPSPVLVRFLIELQQPQPPDKRQQLRHHPNRVSPAAEQLHRRPPIAFRCCRLVLARTKSVNTEFWPRLESAPGSSPSKFCSHHICISQLGGFLMIKALPPSIVNP